MVCMIRDGSYFLHGCNETANSAQRPTQSREEQACTLSAEYL
jgi:hypothetical protein